MGRIAAFAQVAKAKGKLLDICFKKQMSSDSNPVGIKGKEAIGWEIPKQKETIN